MDKIVQIQLDDGTFAYVEISDYDSFIEATSKKASKKVTSDYVAVAGDVLKNLKHMPSTPDSVELSFNIKLAAHSGNLLSWVIAKADAETTVGVKIKWKK